MEFHKIVAYQLRGINRDANCTKRHIKILINYLYHLVGINT